MEQCSNLLITTVQIRETDAEVEKVMFQNFQNTTLYVFNRFAHYTEGVPNIRKYAQTLLLFTSKYVYSLQYM